MSVTLFLEFIKKHKLDITSVKSEQSTTTAQEAAKVHNVPVSNIVKSLVVKQDGEFVLYLCPGDKKLNLEKIGGRMATADEVKEVTGHSIGGVPPFGHKKPLKTVIVDGFDPTEPLWAAAGAQDTNSQTTLFELKKVVALINKLVIDIP
ncbi:MAG: YbaK/EbsC family protein [Candidatus Cloacimonetes bacterium]|nr:YbaK/EbsC family protein [Candidatus Cloacimonadota bacterium]